MQIIGIPNMMQEYMVKTKEQKVISRKQLQIKIELEEIRALKPQCIIDRKKQNEQYEKSHVNNGQIKLRNYLNTEGKERS